LYAGGEASPQRRSHGVRRARGGFFSLSRLSVSDLIFFGAFCVFLFVSGFLTAFGSIGYLTFCLITCIYAFPYLGCGLTPGLLCFTGVGVLYVLLSYMNIFPDAWTRFFLTDWILRQSFFVVMFPFHVTSFRRFWARVIRCGCRDAVVNVSFIASAIGVTLFRLGGIGEYDVTFGDTSVVVYAIPNLMNATIVLMLSWCEIVYRFRTPKVRFVLLLLTLVAVLVTPSNTQTVLVSLAIIGLSMVPLPRFSLAVAYAGLLMAFVFAVTLVPGSVTNDPNTWIRMAFWQDALSAFNQSLWIGVGFGKEAVINLYPGLRKAHYMVDEFRLVGQSIHNSFLYVFYRMGLIGGLAFLYVVFVEFFPKSLSNKKSVRLMLIAHFICVFCLFVNVGLESPYFVVGICWALGLITGTQDATSIEERGGVKLV